MWKYALAAFALLNVPAQAHEMEEGTGVVCDSKAQIERFALLDAAPEAIRVINKDAKQNVCVMAEVRYIRGAKVGESRNKLGTVELVEILVVAFKLHGQWGTISPSVQYTLFVVPEQEASLPLMLVHDVPNVPTENLWWYQNAKTNEEARWTFPSPWENCCNHAEVVPMEQIIFPTDAHGWQWNDNGAIRDIPDVVVHWSEAAPDNKPTLFVYLGIMTCFYPPQGGV